MEGSMLATTFLSVLVCVAGIFIRNMIAEIQKSKELISRTREESASDRVRINMLGKDVHDLKEQLNQFRAEKQGEKSVNMTFHRKLET